ncbi:MAG TPA: DUF4232 domain-containing protein [Trebonia sp.]|nr:DUF4232 domain-containing protein [Trebonia sp.]
MRTAVGLAWRGAAMFAFGATAALAVTLNRPVVPSAALAAAARQQPAPTCATARLAVSLARAAGALGSGYHVDFTNTSGRACTLSGYPQVAAYAVGRSGYAQVGNAALREAVGGASRVLLRPGGTAHWDVDVSAVAPDVACRPVTAAGLRVVPPGASKPRYLRTQLTACSATGPQARVYLRVQAIQPGAGSASNPHSAADPRTARGRPRHGWLAA